MPLMGTTFITEFGLYQYLRALQGHIASGDGYVRRFDDIISGVERKQKFVDDALLYSEIIEEEFYHVFGFLLLSSKMVQHLPHINSILGKN